MINCIIYEDNEKMQVLYQEIIRDYFNKIEKQVKFYIFDKYQKNLEKKLANINGSKFYILDIEVPGKSGLDLAREIRNDGDWESQLIIITSYEYLKNTSFTSKMLMLDFISKKDNLRNRLCESLIIVNDIINTCDNYTFQYNGELYHVNYQNILSFEKDLNDNYTFLYTNDKSYRIKDSITNIEKELLKHRCFFKIHRSCIINVNNIKDFDLENNILYLGDYSTNLLTKESRELLRKHLNNTFL